MEASASVHRFLDSDYGEWESEEGGSGIYSGKLEWVESEWVISASEA